MESLIRIAKGMPPTTPVVSIDYGFPDCLWTAYRRGTWLNIPSAVSSPPPPAGRRSSGYRPVLRGDGLSHFSWQRRCLTAVSRPRLGPSSEEGSRHRAWLAQGSNRHRSKRLEGGEQTETLAHRISLAILRGTRGTRRTETRSTRNLRTLGSRHYSTRVTFPSPDPSERRSTL
jgi:hypothetical protein